MSSFAYLKYLPVDVLKIAGTFVKDMATDPMDYAIVDSINRISHILGAALDLPGRVIDSGIGTPLTLIPITMNTGIRLLWKVRPALLDVHTLHAKLSVTGTGTDGSRDTAVKAVVLR